jgi:hypothetical protein
LAPTILDALGLATPSSFGGTDLAALAEGIASEEQRPTTAERDDRISVRWGSYVLTGFRDRETRLCDLSLDPACVADVRGTSPLALHLIRRHTLEELSFSLPASSSPPSASASPSTLDAHTMAALARWGWPLEENAPKTR